jgi:biopolymer transport protein ExbD
MLLDTTTAQRSTKLSLTPLIDVVFILLLFFMLSSSFIQWRAIDISTPVSASTEQRTTQTVILLDATGQIDINGQRLDWSQTAAISQWISQDVDAVWLIKVRSGLTTQDTINLLDVLTACGAKHVSLAGVE